jgi:hypothetical protein
VAKRVGRSNIGYIGNQTKVRRHYAAPCPLCNHPKP